MKSTFGQPFALLAMLLILHLPATALGQTYSSYDSSDLSNYIPWSWRVKPNDTSATDGNCPSTLSILVIFVIVNIVVSVLTLIASHRQVVQIMTRNIFGGDDSKATWPYMFLLPLGLNLGPNALIAYLYRTTPDFGGTFTIWDLTLFYTTRPRLAWILLVLVMSWDANKTTEKSETNYVRSAKAAVAAEVCLQLMSSFYMGKTAHFAAEHKYYAIHSAAPPTAEVMYAGALLSLVSLFFTIICLATILLAEAKDVFSSALRFILVAVICCTSWLASWLFWGGFVTLAGTEYCPPRLWQSGLIWTVFSVIGAALGGAQ